MARFVLLVLSLTIAAEARSETLKVLALQSERFFEEQGGRYSGIEYEILRYFAKGRNDEIEVEWVSSFSGMLDRIAKGEADIAAGTITITPERSERMDFSAPYFPVQILLVERAGEASSAIEELSGKVGAFAQTTASDALEKVSAVEVVQSADGGLDSMLEAVANGEWSAAAADSSAIIPVIDKYPSLQISLTFGEQQSFGFALPKGSPLTRALSEHVQKLKESNVYFRIVKDHMGPRASEIVRAAKTQ